MATPTPFPCARTPEIVEDFAVVVDAVDATNSDVRVHVCGELDGLTAPTLTAALGALCGSGEQLVDAPYGGTVALNLSRPSSMDTAGLRALVDNRLALVACGWRVCPISAQPQVAWLLGCADGKGWLPDDFLCADVLLPGLLANDGSISRTPRATA